MAMMNLDELVDIISGDVGKTLTDSERSMLIRMLERSAQRGAEVDLLIAECKALIA